MPKCFINKEECDGECVLYRRGFRYSDLPGSKPVPFEACAFNIMTDCMEQMVSRSIGTQAEMNQVRNATEKMTEVMIAALTGKIQARLIK
jgi:hypothetical protein